MVASPAEGLELQFQARRPAPRRRVGMVASPAEGLERHQSARCARLSLWRRNGGKPGCGIRTGERYHWAGRFLGVGMAASPDAGLELPYLAPQCKSVDVGMAASPDAGLEQTMIVVAGAMTWRSEWRQARMRD